MQLIAVERRERRICVASVELEQREMPADVPVHPAAESPVRRERVQRLRAVRGAVPDRERMRERMDRERRARFDFEREPCELLRARAVVRLGGAECGHRDDGVEAGALRRPRPKRVLRDGAHIHAAAEEVPARLREAHRERIAVPVGRELRVDLRRLQRLAREPGARGREMRALARASRRLERRRGDQRALERRQRGRVLRRDELRDLE